MSPHPCPSSTIPSTPNQTILPFDFASEASREEDGRIEIITQSDKNVDLLDFY
jgi:hypothetical protein